MRARAVLFDMDGTLVDSEPVHHRALEDVLGVHGLAVPAGFHEAMTGSTLPTLHAALVERRLLPPGADGLPMSVDALAEAKYAAFLARRCELHPRAGAPEVIAWLQARGVPFAIVSNSDRMLLDAALAAAGLTRPGLVSVSRNDVRHGKPDPEPYRRAAWLLGLEPADCIVVEDSEPGAAAGLAAGCTVLAWPEPHRADAPFPAGVLNVGPSAPLTDALAALLAAPSSGRAPATTPPPPPADPAQVSAPTLDLTSPSRTNLST